MTSQPLSASPEIALPRVAPTAPAAGLHLQVVLNGSASGANLQQPLPTLLPAPQLVEILTVGIGQIVPIFSLPPWVMGVYNWRGQVLWIVDLNHLLGFTPWYEQPDYGSKHTIVVLREISESKEKAIVGLAVSRVEDMVECPADSLHSLPSLPDEVPASLHRFLLGYWDSNEAEELRSKPIPRHWLLNGSAILQSLSELPA